VGVRVRVRIESSGRQLVATALLNTGYESDAPEVLLPLRAAEELGLWPPPPGSRTETYVSASGYVRVVRVPGASRVTVLAGDSNSKSVPVDIERFASASAVLRASHRQGESISGGSRG